MTIVTISHVTMRVRLMPIYSLVLKTIVVTALDPNNICGTTDIPAVFEITQDFMNQSLEHNITLETLQEIITTLPTFFDAANFTNGTSDNQTTMAGNRLATRRGPFLEDGILTREDYDKVRDIRSKLGLPLALCGCFLNVIAVIVYARMPPSFVNRYLIGLQILDTLFLLCVLYPFFLILVHGPEAGTTKSYQVYVKYVNNYLYSCFQRANVFCTAVLSVNRCVIMLAPFNQSVKKIFKHPIRIIVTTQTITFITSLYIIFKNDVYKLVLPDGTERFTLMTTDAYKSHTKLFDNMVLCNSFIFTYIPAIGSFTANVCLIVGLLMISRRTSVSNNTENKKFFKMGNHKTMVVLVYSSLSLVLLLPFMSLPILNLAVSGFGVLQKEHYMYIAMGSVIALCDILRSTMGFFVFLGLSSVFRETFIALILRRQLKSDGNKEPKTAVTSSKTMSLSG